MEEGLGLQVEFESFPDVELAFESLARERSGIELLNVRHEENRTLATVFVPDGKLVHFERLIHDYLAEKRDSAGRVRDNRRLIDAIRQIQAASLQATLGPTTIRSRLPMKSRSGGKCGCPVAGFRLLAALPWTSNRT